MLQSPPWFEQVVPVGGMYRSMMTRFDPEAPVIVPVLPSDTGAFVTIVRSPPTERPERSMTVLAVGWVCQLAYVPAMFVRDTDEKLVTAVADVLVGPHVPLEG